MSALGEIGHAVENYIDEKQRLGFQMNDSELRRFARYADRLGHTGPITAELQITWAKMHVRKTTAGTGTRRLENLSPFVRYYRQYEPSSVLVDPTLLGPKRGRPTPHIYTRYELAALIDAASELEGSNDLHGLVYATFFGLIAVTGLRLSEAINLTDKDVNLVASQLTVRMTKFCKTRRLPIQKSTVVALSAWRQQRDQRWPCDPDGPFFVNQTGTGLKKRSVQNTFVRLRRSLSLRARGAHPQPRIHDLRHTFAVHRVQLWHEQQSSIEQAMFWLCTYLGHSKISDTYWYLTAVPELMAIAGRHFEQYVGDTNACGDS